MPGTFVSDSLETDLLAGATLNSNGTTQSTIVDMEYPQTFSLFIDTGTCTGTSSPTLDVEVEASNSSTFASGIVTIGQVPTITSSDDDVIRGGQLFYSNLRYIRAQVVVGGTDPVFVCVMNIVEPDYRRTDTLDASTN